MKKIIRFFYILVALLSASIFYIHVLNTQQVARYGQKYTYYVSNSSDGVILDVNQFFNIIDKNDETIVNAYNLDGSETYLSNFSDIKLISGQKPQNDKQYITNKFDKSAVGQFQSDLNSMNLSKIYGFPNQGQVRFTEIDFKKGVSDQEKNYLTTNGFVKINQTNLVQKVNSSFYSFLIVLIKLLSFFLGFIILVFWFTFIIKYVDKNEKKIALLKLFGASKVEIIKTYLFINRKIFLQTISELGGLFLVINLVDLLFYHQNIWVPSVIIIVLSALTVIISFSAIFYLKLIRIKNRKILKLIWIFIGAIIFGILAISVYWWSLIVIVIGLFWYLLYRKNLMLKSIFKPSILNISIALSAILAVISVIFILFSASYQFTANSKELFVKTSLPQELMFGNKSEPLDVKKYPSIEEHHIIKPVSGIQFEKQTYFPYITSTKLDYYKTYNLQGKSYTSQSVLVGLALANQMKVHVGDTISFNGKKEIVSNIVNTADEGGYVIYLSDNKYKEIYGNLGTNFYLTNLSKSELSNELGSTLYNKINIVTGQDLQKYYSSTVTMIFSMILVISIIILIVAMILSYQIIDLAIKEVKKEINILRGFGLNFKEYLIVFSQQFIFIVATSICLASYLIMIFSNTISRMILNQAQFWLIIKITLPIIVALFILLMLAFIVSIFLNYRTMKKMSIYQQYLETFRE